MISVGLFLRGRTQGPARREPGNHQGRHVGQIVDRVAYKRDRMPGIARHEFRSNQNESGDYGGAKHTCSACAQAMDVQVAVLLTMFVGVHSLNSTRRIGSAKSVSRYGARERNGRIWHVRRTYVG